MAVGLNTFSTELGSAVTQGLGLDFLDYLSITQQDLGSLGSLGSNNVQGYLKEYTEGGRSLPADLTEVLSRPALTAAA